MRDLGIWVKDKAAVERMWILFDRDGTALACAYPLAADSIAWQVTCFEGRRGRDLVPRDQRVCVHLDVEDMKQECEERLVRAGICRDRAIA